jgi:hypothetical protein
MTIEVRTAITGFPGSANPLDPIFRPDLSKSRETGENLEYSEIKHVLLSSGWRRAPSRVVMLSGPERAVDILYSGSTATPPTSIQTFWGTGEMPSSYPAAQVQLFNLVAVPCVDQGVLSYTPSSFSLAEPNRLILEYASPTLDVTDPVSSQICLANTELTGAPYQDLPHGLLSAIAGALDLAEFVEFEDGMENEFTTRIIDLVKEYGGLAVEKLTSMLFRSGVRPETVAQTLLCFARVDNEVSAQARSRALRRGLRSSSAIVRDAATVGIVATQDVSAEFDLAAAIAREKIRGLREDMQVALSSLRSGE